MARRALAHSARAASEAAKALLNSSVVVRRSLATAIANRSVMAAYAVMSRTVAGAGFLRYRLYHGSSGTKPNEAVPIFLLFLSTPAYFFVSTRSVSAAIGLITHPSIGLVGDQ